jgi:hypothetical protein
MSADTDQSGFKATAIAGGLSTMWGLVLDHLVDKHVQAVAGTKVDPEGGVARTPHGVVVTSKELYLQVLLNADGNYTNAGYQKRMEQSFGPIYLGMDWDTEYEKQSTPANAAIGRITRQDAFEVTLKETRAALPTVPAPSGTVDIQALSDIVLAKVCSHYFDIPDGVYVKAGGFGVSNLVPPGGLSRGLHAAIGLHLPSRSGPALELHRPAHRSNPAGVGREIRGGQARLRPASNSAFGQRLVRAIPGSEGQ